MHWSRPSRMLAAAVALLAAAVIPDACLAAVATQCSPSTGLCALSDPVQLTLYNGNDACAGPTDERQPVSHECLFLSHSGGSLMLNCSIDGAATLATFTSPLCDPSTQTSFGAGAGDGVACMSLYSSAHKTQIVGTATALCPWLLPDSTVTKQDLRPPTGTQPTPVLVPFAQSVVDPYVDGSYGLISHDINADNRMDLLSLAFSGNQVVYYENLGADQSAPMQPVRWKAHLVATLENAIFATFADFNSDGKLDIAIAHAFESVPKNQSTDGLLSWAEQRGPDEWILHPIGQVQGLHRIIAGDFDGDSRAEIIGVPLFSQGLPPMYGPAIITMFDPFEVYTNWNASTLTMNYHVVHNIVPVPKAGNLPGIDLVIACQEGLVLLQPYRGELGWRVNEIVLYDDDTPRPPTPSPNTTSPTAQRGREDLSWYHGVTAIDIARSPPYFFAALDYKPDSYLDDPLGPWHGDTISVYTHGDALDNNIQDLLQPGLVRTVLYRGRSGGHTLRVADINQNGCSDIVAGFRGPYGKGLVMLLNEGLNSSMAKPQCTISFTSQPLSVGAGVNMLALLDADGDGSIDIATVGDGSLGDNQITLYSNRYNAWVLGSPYAGAGTDCVVSASKLAWQWASFVALGMAGLALIALFWKHKRSQAKRRATSAAGGGVVNSATPSAPLLPAQERIQLRLFN